MSLRILWVLAVARWFWSWRFDDWVDLGEGVALGVFRVVNLVRRSQGQAALVEAQLSVFLNQSSAWISFYSQDQA
jgi:hypothetical protein